MEIKLISKNLFEYVSPLFDKCIGVDFAISFIKNSGIELIKPLFMNLQNKSQTSRILFSPAFGLTETQALIFLQKHNAKLQVFKKVNEGIGIFHSKLWIFYFDNNFVQIVIGSSNLTKSALTSNSELNVVFNGSKEDKFISEVIAHFNLLWNSIDSELVTDFFLNNYQNYEIENVRINNANNEKLVLILDAQKKSYNHTFSEIIINSLTNSPLSTRELYKIAKLKVPKLCDDAIFCKHGGGYEWEHILRGAQSNLKNKNKIERTKDGRAWKLI